MGIDKKLKPIQIKWAQFEQNLQQNTTNFNNKRIILFMQAEFIEIDGNKYEGGGQMLRSSIVLSTLLNKPFRIYNIRSNRPNPGINNQLRAILSPFMEKPPPNGSLMLQFYPKIPKLDKISAGTSASCTLMMQCLLPVAVFIGYQGQTILEGGTDVMNCPPSRIVKQVLTQLLSRMGISLTIKNIKPGYYPKGGGSITYNVKVGKQVHAINMTKFNVPTGGSLKYYRTKNNLPETANQFKKQIKHMMRKQFGQDLQLDYEVGVELVKGTKTQDYGISLCLLNQDVVWDCSIVGKQAKQEEVLARLQAQIESKPCVDDNHQDQLLIYMALAHGTSQLRIGDHQSNHTKSMLYVLKEFMPEIKISHEEQILKIEGIGYKYSKEVS